MSFIRTKVIKGNRYAYLVENKWGKRSKRSKQRVKKYLGRVYSFNKKEENDFFEFYNINNYNDYIESNNKNKIISDLIKWSLINHGFKENGKILSFDKLFFDCVEGEGVFRNNNIVIAMNEGFLCNYTIKRILNYKKKGDEENIGFGLAKLFVESGILIPKELFIGFYSKI